MLSPWSGLVGREVVGDVEVFSFLELISRTVEFVALMANCLALARSLNLGSTMVLINQTGDLSLVGITWLPCIWLVRVE